MIGALGGRHAEFRHSRIQPTNYCPSVPQLLEKVVASAAFSLPTTNWLRISVYFSYEHFKYQKKLNGDFKRMGVTGRKLQMFDVSSCNDFLSCIKA